MKILQDLWDEPTKRIEILTHFAFFIVSGLVIFLLDMTMIGYLFPILFIESWYVEYLLGMLIMIEVFQTTIRNYIAYRRDNL